MKIFILGNCANLTNKYRTTSACLEVEGERFLLEAGPGVVPALQDSGIPASSLKYILISHSHGDHSLGFPYVMFSKFAEGLQGSKNVSPVQVIGLPEVLQGIRSMFSFCYPPGRYDSFEIDYFSLKDENLDQHVLTQTVTLKTIGTNHAVSSVAYRFEIGGKAFLFTNDTVIEEDLVKFCEGATAIFAEAFGPGEIAEISNKFGHATAEDAGRLAAEAGAQKLYLTHILPRFMEKADMLIRDASKNFKGQIEVPKENQVIEFSV